MTQRTVLITGASGGFGKTFTKVFLEAGYHVIATIRQENKKQEVLSGISEQERTNLTLLFLDVSHNQSVANFQTALSAFHRIDVLINNAGFAVAGFAEELTIEEYKLQFETNFFGVIRVTNAVLPFMRKQGSGRIINISSISGLVGFPALSPYVSSKYALEGYSESLRLEVKDFGIDVVLLEPGSFQTNIWTSGTHLSQNAGTDVSPYKNMFTSINNRMLAERNSYGAPSEVGELALKIAESRGTPSLRYTVGKGVTFLLILKKLLPWKTWERMVLKQLLKP
jgi:short-subunit dehydrogenase